MAKIVFLMSYQKILDHARTAAIPFDLEMDYRLIPSANPTDEQLLQLIQDAEIVISRGLDAVQLKQITTVPVIEITVSSTELGMLICQAKQEHNLSHPRIAIVTPRNMLCDISLFDQLYDVETVFYDLKRKEDAYSLVLRAREEGADFLLGGHTTVAKGEELGLPSYVLPSDQFSVDQALQVASQISYAIDLEKQKNAELRTLLNYSFNGIVRLNTDGTIATINPIANSLLNDGKEESLVGQLITQAFPALEEKRLFVDVLQKGEKIYSIPLFKGHSLLSVNLSPITVDSHIEGAILSFQEIPGEKSFSRGKNTELGNCAKYTFERIAPFVAESSEPFQQLKNFAVSDLPILLTGGTFRLRAILAQCVHNASTFSDSPFLHIDCAAYTPQQQIHCLFSARPGQSLLSQLQGGTLHFNHVEALCPQAQSRLLRLMQDQVLLRDDLTTESIHLPCRVIASTGADLEEQVRQGLFDGELWRLLATLPFSIPPLTGHGEEIALLASHFIEDCCKKRSRFMVLNAGGKSALQHHSWPGHVDELSAFCERLVLSANSRVLDGSAIRKYFSPESDSVPPAPAVSPQEQLSALLEKYHGNRSLMAAELGVSKTTLWRRLKQYGLM